MSYKYLKIPDLDSHQDRGDTDWGREILIYNENGETKMNLNSDTATNERTIKDIVEKYLATASANEQFTDDAKKSLTQFIASEVSVGLSNTLLKERLDILYDHEKKYLDLTKDYKEEIKFAASLQEDIRKERAKFFAEVLREVHKTLEEAKLDKKATDLWITELVVSYTKSLDISSDLAKDHLLDMLGSLRTASQQSIKTLDGDKGLTRD
jgi:hypothetical protein